MLIFTKKDKISLKSDDSITDKKLDYICKESDYTFTDKALNYICKNYELDEKNIGRIKSNWRNKEDFLFELGRLNDPEINKLLAKYYYRDKKYKDIDSTLNAAFSRMQEDKQKNYPEKSRKIPKGELFTDDKKPSEAILFLDFDWRSPDFIKFEKRNGVWIPVRNHMTTFP
jgi:hypothetical protein